MGKTCPFCFISCASVEAPVLTTYLNRCFSDSEHVHSSYCVSGRATATYQDVREQRKAFQGLWHEKLHFKEINIGMELRVCPASDDLPLVPSTHSVSLHLPVSPAPGSLPSLASTGAHTFPHTDTYMSNTQLRVIKGNL